MPGPRRRFDAYGRPLPRLVQDEPRDLHGTSSNRQQQQLIERLLQEEYDALLVHGIYAEVTLTFVIKDGSIATDVYVVRCQQHRAGEEEVP
jgi:hypothetical protein